MAGEIPFVQNPQLLKSLRGEQSFLASLRTQDDRERHAGLFFNNNLPGVVGELLRNQVKAAPTLLEDIHRFMAIRNLTYSGSDHEFLRLIGAKLDEFWSPLTMPNFDFSCVIPGGKDKQRHRRREITQVEFDKEKTGTLFISPDNPPPIWLLFTGGNIFKEEQAFPRNLRGDERDQAIINAVRARYDTDYRCQVLNPGIAANIACRVTGTRHNPSVPLDQHLPFADFYCGYVIMQQRNPTRLDPVPLSFNTYLIRQRQVDEEALNRITDYELWFDNSIRTALRISQGGIGSVGHPLAGGSFSGGS